MSYKLKSIVILFDVFINGDENVNVFCFVLFKLVIDNVELLDNEFKLVFVAYVVKSGLFVIAL